MNKAYIHSFRIMYHLTYNSLFFCCFCLFAFDHPPFSGSLIFSSVSSNLYPGLRWTRLVEQTILQDCSTPERLCVEQKRMSEANSGTVVVAVSSGEAFLHECLGVSPFLNQANVEWEPQGTVHFLVTTLKASMQSPRARLASCVVSLSNLRHFKLDEMPRSFSSIVLSGMCVSLTTESWMV